MCWVCKRWKRSSPKTFARWVRMAQGQGNARDAGLMRAARKAADDAIADIGLEKLREHAARGDDLYIEGELVADFDLSKADYTFFDWVVRHGLAEAIEGRPN